MTRGVAIRDYIAFQFLTNAYKHFLQVCIHIYGQDVPRRVPASLYSDAAYTITLVVSELKSS